MTQYRLARQGLVTFRWGMESGLVPRCTSLRDTEISMRVVEVSTTPQCLKTSLCWAESVKRNCEPRVAECRLLSQDVPATEGSRRCVIYAQAESSEYHASDCRLYCEQTRKKSSYRPEKPTS